jgi:hypothetical protein
MKKIFLLALCALSWSYGSAQNVSQNAGWFMVLNSTKFNDRWGMHFDFQLRTQNNWDGVRNLLVRPGVTYYINQKSNATLGYLYAPTFLQDDTPLGGAKLKTSLTEHRIWQQYIYAHQPWKGAALIHRFRLEQRFIERQTDDLFSQRLRYFVRLMQPLRKQDGAFTKGMFAAIQNEVFLNLQNNEQLNSNVFDQNRAYLAVGYRTSNSFDIEVGYLNQAINGAVVSSTNNAIQLALYTRF